MENKVQRGQLSEMNTKLFKNHFANRKRGIGGRMIQLFILLVIVPFFASSIVTALAFQTYMTGRIGDTTADSMSLLAGQISDSLERYEEDSMFLYYNGYIDYLGTGSLDTWRKNRLESAINTICSMDSKIHSVYLISDGTVLSGGSTYSTIYEIMEPYQEEIKAAGGAPRWYPTNRLLGNELQNKYILARSLNSETKKNVGILYMVLDDRIVTEPFEKLQADYAQQYLTDGDGQILYTSSADSEISDTLDISVINPNYIQDRASIRKDSKSWLVISHHLYDTDWFCISMISESESMDSIWNLEFPFLVTAVVYLIFLAIMLAAMRKYVFYPLRVLKKNMDEYACGNLNATQMEPVGTGEFYSLSSHFNGMTGRIERLMEDYKAEEDEKNRQKMNALAAQLTPHFVYNALNTIKWVAVLNHQENIRHLTEALIYIFMNAAKADDGQYLLSDEIELIKNYSVIQKTRFMNFDLEFDVTEESKNCHIRKLLLQPSVENAIVHGLGRGKVKESKILVRAWTDTSLHIVIRDEGIGFDVEAWRRNPEKRENHTNIGIHNLQEIMELEYGSPYGMEIMSSPGKGTTVTYLLPIIKANPAADSPACVNNPGGYTK